MLKISSVAMTLGCFLLPVACLPAQAVGQSAQSAPAAQQKSTAGATTTATFVNSDSQDVDLYWIGYDGKEQKMATIAGGKRIAADSAIGHIWKLKMGQRDVATFNVANANPEFEFKGMAATPATPAPNIRSAPPTIRSGAPASPPRPAAPPPRPPSASAPPRPAATGAPPRPAAPSTPSTRGPAPPRIATPNAPPRANAPAASAAAPSAAQQLPTVWRGEEEIEFKRLSDGGWILAGDGGEVLENLKEVTRRNRFARLALSDMHSFLIVDDAVFESEHPEDCYFMMAGQWQEAQRANVKRKLTHWKGTRDKSVLEWRRESDGKWSFLADGRVESQWEEDFDGSETGQALVVLLQPAEGIVAEVYDGVTLEHLEDEDSFAIVSYGFFQDVGPTTTRPSGTAAPQAAPPQASSAPRAPSRPSAPPPPPKRN